MITETQSGTALHALVEQVVGAAGLELVQAEWRGDGRARLLRVTIDRPAGAAPAGDPPTGVGLADCERVSRALGEALDHMDATLPASAYTLEVSSPGLDRPLLKPADFERFAGQRVQIRARLAEGPRSWTGYLQGAGADGVRLEAESGGEVVVAWEQLERARLAPQWRQPRRPGKKQ